MFRGYRQLRENLPDYLLRRVERTKRGLVGVTYGGRSVKLERVSSGVVKFIKLLDSQDNSKGKLARNLAKFYPGCYFAIQRAPSHILDTIGTAYYGRYKLKRN